MSLKEQAGRKAADYVKEGMIVGLGTGSTVYFTLQALGERVAKGESFLGIPTSESTLTIAKDLNITLTSLEVNPVIDMTIDGADEVDPHLNLIKGLGGALLREKVVAQASKEEVICVDDSKIVTKLCEKAPIPLEVLPFAKGHVLRKLEALGGRPVIRHKEGVIVYSDNQNLLIDCWFDPLDDPQAMETDLLAISGILETGLFLGLAHHIVIAGEDGISIMDK